MVNFSTLLPPSKLGYLRKFIPPFCLPTFWLYFRAGKLGQLLCKRELYFCLFLIFETQAFDTCSGGVKRILGNDASSAPQKCQSASNFWTPPPRLKVSNILENLARFSRVLCLLKNWFSDFIFVDWLVSYANQNASSSWILKYFLRVEKKNQVCVKESEDSIFDRCRLLYLS